jgi:hypothetical protein
MGGAGRLHQMRGRHCGSVETFVECMQERLRLVPPGTVEKKRI